ILGAPTPAQATFSVRITTLSNPGGTTITDGGPGDLDLVVNNHITVNYSDASYDVVGTIALTNAPGTPSVAILDVSFNIDTLGTTGGAATLETSATGFTQPSINPLTLT